MTDSVRLRLRLVASVMFMVAAAIIYRLITIQFDVDRSYFSEQALTEYRDQIVIKPPRGEIYDRNGVLLATNQVEYEIAISPPLILDRTATAQAITDVLNGVGEDVSYEELLEQMSPDENGDVLPYVLVSRPAPAAAGQQLLELDLDGVVIVPIMRRFYPHDSLAAHILGFVSGDEVGYFGIEGYYNEALIGKLAAGGQSRIPFEAKGDVGQFGGATLYLTIDSEIQYLAETTLAEALEETGAEKGSIVVLEPQTGEILAMTSTPTGNPNEFFNEDLAVFNNPVVNQQYEPGSTLKALTMALALEKGVVNQDSVYVDTGVFEVGGIDVYNWDRKAHGPTSMIDLLAKSLNVGAATLSLQIGPTDFYNGLEAFGIGEPTGIDLEGEAAGMLRKPGNAEWYDGDLAVNSFGQGLACTPLQLVTAVGAIANDGKLMQPHLVARRIEPNGDEIIYEPTLVRQVISPETAETLTRMLAVALEREASAALVDGYTIAGKTGTAEIPIPGGYDPELTIGSFVGYGPIDNPQFVVLIKLDKPTESRWGSETAAPVFSKFVQRLVILMEIPPDDVRLAMNR